jgi:hypothetical protein
MIFLELSSNGELRQKPRGLYINENLPTEVDSTPFGFALILTHISSSFLWHSVIVMEEAFKSLNNSHFPSNPQIMMNARYISTIRNPVAITPP